MTTPIPAPQLAAAWRLASGHSHWAGAIARQAMEASPEAPRGRRAARRAVEMGA